MKDETASGPAGTPDNSRHQEGSASVSSPFQARAAFVKNWDWQSIISINRGACERGKAQHGLGSEASISCAEEWESFRAKTVTLLETFDHLLQFHRRAPFLFFNGNTFASIGRELSFALFADLPPVRRREVGSAVAHYIAGVLDRESMIDIVESLSHAADLKPGDRVKTLRGSTRGKILRILEDGRVVWRPDATKSELMVLPESLVKDDGRKPKIGK